MKHYLIKSINCIVSDAEPEIGEWCKSVRYKEPMKFGTFENSYSDECKKVLFSNSPLEGLKPFELVDEVEELANESSMEKFGTRMCFYGEVDNYEMGFIAGYKDKEGYTESQMIGFAEWYDDNSWMSKDGVFHNIRTGININKKELLALYLKEQESRMIEVIQISDNRFKLKQLEK